MIIKLEINTQKRLKIKLFEVFDLIKSLNSSMVFSTSDSINFFKLYKYIFLNIEILKVLKNNFLEIKNKYFNSENIIKSIVSSINNILKETK